MSEHCPTNNAGYPVQAGRVMQRDDVRSRAERRNARNRLRDHALATDSEPINLSSPSDSEDDKGGDDSHARREEFIASAAAAIAGYLLNERTLLLLAARLNYS